MITLTPRQRAVARLVAEGLPNKDAARRLGISESTLKAHLTVVYQVLGLTSRVQLALYVAHGRLLE